MRRYFAIFCVLWSIFGSGFANDEEASETLDDVFGNFIDWQGIDAATNEKSEKPVTLIIHKNWCEACQSLKKQLLSSDEFEEYAEDFVMINTDADEVSKRSRYDIDGKYVPRIIFIRNGTILEHVYNEKRKDKKYYYSSPQDIIISMEKVLEEMDNETLPLSRGRGLGEDINWSTYPEGVEESRKSGKAMMIIIHKTWCGSCKIMKPKFQASKEIYELSEQFVMVNTEDDDEPKDNKFNVDGAYVPRIFFVEPNGRVMDEVWNEGTSFPHVKYYYAEPSRIVRSMKRVIEKATEWKNRDNGFGDKIDWLSFPDGERESRRSGKPMMLIIHKSWCGSCKNLKPKFASSDEILELSRNFILVNAEDDDEPKDSKFVIDGAYVPRILFVDSVGRVMEEIWNEGTSFPHVKYYYGEPEQIVRSMKIVLEKERSSSNLHNGWGKGIKWESLENAKKLSKQRGAPMLLIVHKSWCQACKILKSSFSKSEEIVNISSNFVMVNVEDNDEKLGPEYDVNGAYVPRLYFIDPQTGKVMEEFTNDAYDDEFIYSYGNDKQLIKTMKKVIDRMQSGEDLSGGLGEGIVWSPFNKLSTAQKRDKPIMLVFHRSWCQFSQGLKEEFALSPNIKAISELFVMVNVEDDEIPTDAKYNLDGVYVPRILFLDSNGNVDETIINENRKDKKSKYFYQHGIDVVASMKLALEKFSSSSLERGFGKQIHWVTMDEGLQQAESSGKPIFLIIHKPGCPACETLKSVFSSSKELPLYSKSFVMVNLEEHEEPKDAQFDVDGKYYPRIFILDAKGVVQRDLHNMNPEYVEYKFSYSTERNIIVTMNDALWKFKKDESKDHGFGENLKWVSYKEGVEESKQSGKPMLLIIHKSWCSSCKTLKKKVAASKKLEELSKYFVMVNSEDDEEPEDELFDVDGSYYPRTFFIDPSGKTMLDIYNSDPTYEENKYYYWDADSIAVAMEKALDKIKMENLKKDEL